MKAAALFLAFGLAGGLWGQRAPARFVGAPSPGVGPGLPGRPGIGGHRPARVVGGWGWGWGGWVWWNPEPLRIVIQQEPEKEKEAPAYVTNKDYVAERPAPRLTEVASAPAPAVQPGWKDCDVRLIGGESFKGVQCAEVDNSVLVKAESGRRYRFSADLIESLK